LFGCHKRTKLRTRVGQTWRAQRTALAGRGKREERREKGGGRREERRRGRREEGGGRKEEAGGRKEARTSISQISGSRILKHKSNCINEV
jgi:hypothetical protein